MRPNHRQAFTLIELLVVIAIIALLVGILLPVLAAARRTAREAVCTANLSNHGKAAATYASDHKDRFATYSWRREIPYAVYGSSRTYGPYGTDYEAAQWQVLDLLNRYAAIGSDDPDVPFPYTEYNSIFLAEYFSQRIPEPVGICPADRQQLQWAADPAATIAQFPQDALRWARSSYTVPLAFFGEIDRESSSAMLRLAENSSVQVHPLTPLGTRKLGDIYFPSQKVMYHERFSRHARPAPAYFTHPQAVVTVAIADGSVRSLRTSDANQGGYAQADGTIARQSVSYLPSTMLGDPAWPDAASPSQPPRYAATVGGLKGVDFGSPEVLR